MSEMRKQSVNLRLDTDKARSVYLAETGRLIWQK